MSEATRSPVHLEISRCVAIPTLAHAQVFHRLFIAVWSMILLPMVIVSASRAAEITDLSVSLAATNDGDSNDRNPRQERVSEISILASSASSFESRYAQIIAVDVAALGRTHRLEARSRYRIDFRVQALIGEAWVAKIGTQRRGALTIRHDGGKSASVHAGAIAGTVTGVPLATGTIGLPSAGSLESRESNVKAINQSSEATLLGVGPQGLVLEFGWDSFAESNANAKGGDEAAVRLGLSSALQRIDAGDYPGAGDRSRLGDGHFVKVELLSQVTVEKPRIRSVETRLNSKNTGSLDSVGPRYEVDSEASILSSSATAFESRYAQIIALDVSAFGARTNRDVTSDYSIHLNIEAEAPWALTVSSRRKGHLTLAGGADQEATASVGMAEGMLAGSGSIVNGGLDFDNEFSASLGSDRGFEELAEATIVGCESGEVELRFSWDSSVFSGRAEAAVRFGLASDMRRISAGDYPGPGDLPGRGDRVRLEDGHFVTANLASFPGACKRSFRSLPGHVGVTAHRFLPSSLAVFSEGQDAETGDGAGFGLGLWFDYAVSSNSFVFLRIDRQAAELDNGADADFVHYQVGARYAWGSTRWQPFAFLGLGMSKLEMGRRSDESLFSTSVGAGVDYLFHRRLGFRGEGGLLWAHGTKDLWQASLSAGVFFRW